MMRFEIISGFATPQTEDRAVLVVNGLHVVKNIVLNGVCYSEHTDLDENPSTLPGPALFPSHQPTNSSAN